MRFNKAILFIFLTMQFIMQGQLTKEKLTEMHRKIHPKLDITKPELYNQGLQELKQLENRVIQTKDTTLLLQYYSLDYGFFINIFDYLNAEKQLLKCRKILNKKPFPNELGRYYYCLSLIERDTLKKIEYLELAGVYIKKYGTIKEINDYNITHYRAYLYNDINKSLKSSLESLNPIAIEKNDEFLIYQLTNIIRCYVKLKEFEKAKKYLIQLEKLDSKKSIKIKNFEYVEFIYNYCKVITEEKNSKTKELLLNAFNALEKFFLHKFQATKRVEKTLQISYSINQSNLEKIRKI